jgi:hypothetical protein
MLSRSYFLTSNSSSLRLSLYNERLLLRLLEQWLVNINIDNSITTRSGDRRLRFLNLLLLLLLLTRQHSLQLLVLLLDLTLIQQQLLHQVFFLRGLATFSLSGLFLSLDKWSCLLCI